MYMFCVKKSLGIFGAAVQCTYFQTLIGVFFVVFTVHQYMVLVIRDNMQVSSL